MKKLFVIGLFCLSSCASGPKLLSSSTINGEPNSGFVVAEMLTEALERAEEFCGVKTLHITDQHTEKHRLPVWDELFKRWKYVSTNVWVVSFNCMTPEVLL